MRFYGPFLLLFLLAGCNRHQGSDITEKNHPKLVKAREMVRMQDVEGAEVLLLEFLYKHPDYALTHLQLGMVYQSKNAPIKAVYHFQKYLEARPESEKAIIITQVIEDERRRLGVEARISQQPVVTGSPEARVQDLEQKLGEAEQKLAIAEVNLQQLRLKQGGGSTEPPPVWATEKLALLQEINRLKADRSTSEDSQVPSLTANPESETYTVKGGDTLSRISQKMYGEASQWRKIYQANQAKIPNQNALKLGTILVIPK
jgi:LysM repeat protein